MAWMASQNLEKSTFRRRNYEKEVGKTASGKFDRICLSLRAFWVNAECES
jgi:hypothetical protein